MKTNLNTFPNEWKEPNSFKAKALAWKLNFTNELKQRWKNTNNPSIAIFIKEILG